MTGADSVHSSVYTSATTVRVENNNMAIQQQEEEEEYDIQHHPLSCMDNACEGLIGFFGAGSDKQDEEMTNALATSVSQMEAALRSPMSFISLSTNPSKEEEQQEVEETKDFEPAVVSPSPAKNKNKTVDTSEQPEEQAASITSPSPTTTTSPTTDAPPQVTPQASPAQVKRTFSLTKTIKNNKNKKSKKTPKVTVDDDQVEARRKKGFGRWWKKRLQKSRQQRSKSAPRHRGTVSKDTVPPSPSTVASKMMEPEFVDMTSQHANGTTPGEEEGGKQSAASFAPRKHAHFQEDSDNSDDSEDDDEELDVWKELNAMWEESGHDLVRVVSDNLSVHETQATAMEEQDILAKYEQAVEQEERRNQPVDVAV